MLPESPRPEGALGLADYPEHMKLDHQLCFLVYRIHLRLNALYRPLLEPLGLTYPQYLVMLVLWEQGQMTVGQLGERLKLDSGTLSPLLKRLMTQGLVDRQRNPADERQVLVQPSAAGKALWDQARDIPQRLGACIAAGTSPAPGPGGLAAKDVQGAEAAIQTGAFLGQILAGLEAARSLEACGPDGHD